MKKRPALQSPKRAIWQAGGSRTMLRCVSTTDERRAEIRHAMFCGTQELAIAPGDPVGLETGTHHGRVRRETATE